AAEHGGTLGERPAQQAAVEALAPFEIGQHDVRPAGSAVRECSHKSTLTAVRAPRPTSTRTCGRFIDGLTQVIGVRAHNGPYAARTCRRHRVRLSTKVVHSLLIRLFTSSDQTPPRGCAAGQEAATGATGGVGHR